MASLENLYSEDDKPQEFAPIAAGNYVAAIIESDMKTTSAGTGEYLKLTWEIIEGPMKGRKLFENLNLQNPNQQAVEIARGSFAAIRKATGVIAPKDSVDLHNIIVVIKVGVEKRKDTGNLQNRIKGYSSIKENNESKPVKKSGDSGPAPYLRKTT